MMMRGMFLVILLLAWGMADSASAHFGMVIPSQVVIEEKADATVTVTISFSHPMEGVGMPMARPRSVKAITDGTATEVAPRLQPAKVMDHDAWTFTLAFEKPGVYALVVEPEPYWEPAEDCFIVHYTKTYLSVFGEGEGWDEPTGAKTEIVPLSQPFGNYAGNVFRGRVLLDGKAVAGAMVEVEYYNREGKYEAPNGQMVTQGVKADDNGVFVYGVPFAGWWGFAALNTSDERKEHDGEMKDVELGAVLWAEFVDPIRK